MRQPYTRQGRLLASHRVLSGLCLMQALSEQAVIFGRERDALAAAAREKDAALSRLEAELEAQRAQARRCGRGTPGGSLWDIVIPWHRVFVEVHLSIW